jgi:hypothetical protein
MRLAVPPARTARPLCLAAIVAATIVACGNPVAPPEPKAAKPTPKLTSSATGVMDGDTTQRGPTIPWY